MKESSQLKANSLALVLVKCDELKEHFHHEQEKTTWLELDGEAWLKRDESLPKAVVANS